MLRRYGYIVIYEIDAHSRDEAWEAMAQLRMPNGFGFVRPIPAANIRELEPKKIPPETTGDKL